MAKNFKRVAAKSKASVNGHGLSHDDGFAHEDADHGHADAADETAAPAAERDELAGTTRKKSTIRTATTKPASMRPTIRSACT